MKIIISKEDHICVDSCVQLVIAVSCAFTISCFSLKILLMLRIHAQDENLEKATNTNINNLTRQKHRVETNFMFSVQQVHHASQSTTLLSSKNKMIISTLFGLAVTAYLLKSYFKFKPFFDLQKKTSHSDWAILKMINCNPSSE